MFQWSDSITAREHGASPAARVQICNTDQTAAVAALTLPAVLRAVSAVLRCPGHGEAPHGALRLGLHGKAILTSGPSSPGGISLTISSHCGYKAKIVDCEFHKERCCVLLFACVFVQGGGGAL